MTTPDLDAAVRAGTRLAVDDEAGWGGRHAHDPTAVRGDDGWFYLFSTDTGGGRAARPGVQVRRSRDLVTWEWFGRALDDVPGPAREWSGAEGLWAPEVVRWDDRFHMYYSASSFGSTRSAIGLAVADRLTGPWTDHGVVVATGPSTEGPNAIDANVVRDEAGDPWLVYGSFFAGIHVLRLDRATGLALTPGDLGVCIARRSRAVDRAVEGAYVLRSPVDGQFVLLVSYDSLFSTYNVRVGRSPSVTGPYRDRSGNVLTDVDGAQDRIGTKLLGSHQFAGGPAWLAPGHASVLTDGDETFLVHHVREGADPTQHHVQVRRLLWDADGWPHVSPQPYAGEPLRPVDAGDVPGPWAVVELPDRADVVAASRSLEVRAEDLSAAEPLDHGLAVTWHAAGRAVRGIVHASWDAVHDRPALSFSGTDPDGRAVLATRLAQG
jgi:arabinan endo-1,5-alpha-L-arabinosidase